MSLAVGGDLHLAITVIGNNNVLEDLIVPVSEDKYIYRDSLFPLHRFPV